MLNLTGQGGRRHRQDQHGHPRRSLPRDRPARLRRQHRRATRRLPRRRWLLS